MSAARAAQCTSTAQALQWCRRAAACVAAQAQHVKPRKRSSGTAVQSRIAAWAQEEKVAQSRRAAPQPHFNFRPGLPSPPPQHSPPSLPVPVRAVPGGGIPGGTAGGSCGTKDHSGASSSDVS